MSAHVEQTDPLAAIVHDVIESKRAEIRLFPDLYSDEVATAIRAAGWHQ